MAEPKDRKVPYRPRKSTVKTRAGGTTREVPAQMAHAMAGALLSQGETKADTARALGIKEETLHYWLRHGKVLEAPPDLVEANRRAMATVFLSKFMEIANQLTEAKIKNCSAAQLGVLLGIFSDKINQVLGKGEQPLVNINLGDTLPIDQQIERQLDKHREELAKRARELETTLGAPGDGGTPPGNSEA